MSSDIKILFIQQKSWQLYNMQNPVYTHFIAHSTAKYKQMIFNPTDRLRMAYTRCAVHQRHAVKKNYTRKLRTVMCDGQSQPEINK